MTEAGARPGKLHYLALGIIFLLALLPRLYSAQTVGWNWDQAGSFTLVNFDEGGSCRAALQGFDYTPFVGYQTLLIARFAGVGPPDGIAGNPAAVKRYCHSAAHLLVARSWSAVLGALTTVLIGLCGWRLLPRRPQVGLTAAALLALSGFHISESFSGTVDAASVFYIYLFTTLLVLALTAPSRAALALTPLGLVAAVWSKYWVFAVFAYAAALSTRLWRLVTAGLGPLRLLVALLGACVVFGLASNQAFQETSLYPLLAVFYLVIPWRHIHRAMWLPWLALPVLAVLLAHWPPYAAFTTGGMTSNFGSGYAAIGWNKWLRNPLNVILVLLVGLGLPACLVLPAGIKAMLADRATRRGWLCFLPMLLFLLFMAFLSPVTYYRHYLPLLPIAALLAALGFWQLALPSRRLLLVLFLLWPALLAVDLVADYHRDPRIALRSWYRQASPQRVFMSYYVNPPRAYARAHRVFRPEYAEGPNAPLRWADYLVLSENWYDTSFANELNGPYTARPERLVKTTPAYAAFYRRALAGQHPLLVPERAFNVHNFMPELVLHKAFYGTFQMFVGDIRVLRVVADGR